MNLPRIAFRCVGAACIVMAALGMLYNAATFVGSFSPQFANMQNQMNVPYVFPAFYVMSAICVACYVLLIVCGIAFIRLKRYATNFLFLLVLYEVLYYVAVGAMWRHRELGTSIAAATGIATGGMMAQALTLFPLWSLPIAWLAGREMFRSHTRSADAVSAVEEHGQG